MLKILEGLKKWGCGIFSKNQITGASAEFVIKLCHLCRENFIDRREEKKNKKTKKKKKLFELCNAVRTH